mmetsp:Transcript_116809/g.227140  ORF Transcript_116809/g.227140 Transcript_116809/m.227140 type:complete len:372 (-) Transcript_116809:38-1153(-)
MKAMMTSSVWLLLMATSAAATGDFRLATTQLPLADWRLPLDSLARDTHWVTRREPMSLLAVDNSIRVDGSKEIAREAKQAHQSWFALFTFAFILKGLCMLSNLLGQVSPVPQVMRFHKTGDTGDADAAPFMSMLYGGFQWSLYGFFAFIVTGRSGFLVLVYSNIFGGTLGVCYVCEFHRNCKNKETLRRLFIYYKIAASFFSMQLLAILFLDTQNALFFCGLLSSICGLIGACSLLTTLPQVMRTRCSSSINVPLLYCGLISGSLWLLCGIMLRDPWMTGPNVVGLMLLCCALTAVLIFPREPISWQISCNEPTGEKEAMDEDKDMEKHKLDSLPTIDATVWGRRMLVPSWRDERKLGYGAASQLGETGGT